MEELKAALAFALFFPGLPLFIGIVVMWADSGSKSARKVKEWFGLKTASETMLEILSKDEFLPKKREL